MNPNSDSEPNSPQNSPGSSQNSPGSTGNSPESTRNNPGSTTNSPGSTKTTSDSMGLSPTYPSSSASSKNTHRTPHNSSTNMSKSGATKSEKSKKDKSGEHREHNPADLCRVVQWEVGPFNILGKEVKRFKLIRFNPVVTFCSALFIWAFIGIAIKYPKQTNEELAKVKRWVTATWTWLYVGTQDVWAFFILLLYFSKYGKVKLGKDDEVPEFNNTSYFTMLFAAGIGVGLFYFGVAEPIYHYAPGPYGNRYWARYTDNQRAQDALFVTMFHWGIHGWVVYVLVGLLLGVIAYRNNLPMTMRSCFYPLMGDRIMGTMGDIVDTLSVVCTMFGVCTSLGLGVMQLMNGLNLINPNIEISLQNMIILIWSITAVATCSVISGVKLGIRRLSELCFSVGMFIWLIVFFYDETWYLLNLFCQTFGYYFQYIIQIGFHTDAFAQMNQAPDGLEAPTWMDDWTIFYWGWWISWSPFVGMFIARISKGRTIREFVTYTMTVPFIYTLMWFTVFGGAGLRMERDAELWGVNCSSPLGGTNATQPFMGVYRLSCRQLEFMWFDLMSRYEGLSTFLSVISLMSIVLYFVTSSDSGSLIIDCLSANGDPEPPMAQRIFWALTEGAAATALLTSGAGKNNDALKALQTVSICGGLFYTIILNFMCVSLWRALKIDLGKLDKDRPQFAIDLFEPFYMVNSILWLKTLLAIVAPWWAVSSAASRINGGNRIIFASLLAVTFYGWITLTVMQVLNAGLFYVGWAVYFGYVALATGTRSSIRERYHLEGNLAEDFFSNLLLYPMAAVQMEHEMDHHNVPKLGQVKDLKEKSDDNLIKSDKEKNVGKSAKNNQEKKAKNTDLEKNVGNLVKSNQEKNVGGLAKGSQQKIPGSLPKRVKSADDLEKSDKEKSVGDREKSEAGTATGGKENTAQRTSQSRRESDTD